MILQFLSAENGLTKKFTRNSDGSIQKTNFLHAYHVTSYAETVNNLDDFYAQLVAHASKGHCILKGQLDRPLVNESRAGHTTPHAETWYVCLDFDGIDSAHSVESLLAECGLGNVSYLLQWSASQGILNSSLRCHVFMLLSRPASAELLKLWLTQLNFQSAALTAHLALTKTALSLSYGLDISACQNDKLIYIAPPILEGIKSPLGRRARYELVKKDRSHLDLPTEINAHEQNRQLVNARIRELRALHKLPVHRLATRMYRDVEIMSKPGEVSISGRRTERGFTYFNFNGGDSWAYYHPEDNCEIIYNFKGEMPYATKELLPEYYTYTKHKATAALKQQTGVGAYRAADDKPILLAFRDNASGTYKHGEYHPATDTLNLTDARSEKQIRDFCFQYKMPMGDFIPIWEMVFEPQNPKRLDEVARRINMYQQTKYQLAGKVRAHAQVPRTINKIVSHILAGDQAAINHLFNWLAYIVQLRARPTTGWVWYGTEGTGKGVFANNVLRPLFGMGQTAMRRGDELSQPYNTYMKNNTLVFFDEAHIAEMRDAEYVMAKLRNFITEPVIQIRAMYSNAVEHPNFAGIICLSNKPNVITLQKNDRRWNIGPFQREKLVLTDKEVHEIIPSELQAFYDFLLGWNLDEDAARTPLISDDRDRLIGTTTSSADEVAEALFADAGCMEFFLDQLPTNVSGNTAGVGAVTLLEYRNLLRTLIMRGMTDGTGRVKIARDELHVLFEYTVGNMPKTPNKFTKFLMHRHIHTEKVRIDKPVYGIAVNFKDYAHFAEYLRDYFPDPKLQVVKPARHK